MIIVRDGGPFQGTALIRAEPARIELAFVREQPAHLLFAGSPRRLLAGDEVAPEFEGRVVEVSPPAVFDLAEMKARPDWQDHGLWAVGLDPEGFVPTRPFNLAAETVASKLPGRHLAMRNGESYPAMLYVPSREVTDLAGCGLTLCLGSDLPVACDRPVTSMPAQNLRDRIMPRLRLDGPSTVPADGYVTLDLAALRHDGLACPWEFDIHLETTGGYLPRARVPTQGGRAIFKVGALGLEPGESFKVKAGFRLFSGMAEHILTVA